MTGFVQQFLSVSRHLLLFGLVLLAWPFLRERPDFSGWEDAVVDAAFHDASQRSPDGWSLHGAWAVSSSDPRIAGFSALACLGDGRLEIATDLGNLVAFRAPAAGGRVALDVKGHEQFNEGEAMFVRDGARFIAQENFAELLVLLPDGRTASQKLPVDSMFPNLGIEALLDLGAADGFLAFHERGKIAYRIADDAVTPFKVEGAVMSVTDAAWHPDGRAFVLQRAVGPLGFRAALSRATWDGSRVTLGPPLMLPMPLNANAEGICIEPRGAGSTRLWVVTDDNGLPVMAQRLIGWDVPDDAWPETPGGAAD